MKSEFWHKCWERNQLGFHQQQVHPFLERYFSTLLNPSDKHVFVPLCGKSLDMLWLADKMAVTGAELSEIACRDFFVENNIPLHCQSIDKFQCFTHEELSLYQGDFFNLKPNDIAPCDWIYDRAALIALPKAMQQQYVAHLLSFMREHTRLFLITLEFPEHELVGPPFPVCKNDVHRLFEGYQVDCICSHELPDKCFAQRQFEVSQLVEQLYVITR